MLVDGRIYRARADQRIGEPAITILVVVLVEGNDQKTIVSLRPLVIVIDVLPKPGIARWDAFRRFTIVHIVIEVRND